MNKLSDVASSKHIALSNHGRGFKKGDGEAKKDKKTKKTEGSVISSAHLRYYAEFVLYILFFNGIAILTCVV